MINMVEKNEDIESRKAIEKVHTTLNHKGKEQMIYAYINAGRLTEEVRKRINVKRVRNMQDLSQDQRW